MRTASVTPAVATRLPARAESTPTTKERRAWPSRRGARCDTLFAGISSGRDAAVALFDGERLIAAVEEEKLSRTRTRALLPERALRFCLQEAGASLDDLSVIALSSRPRRAWLREQQVRARWLMLPLRKGLRTAADIRQQLTRLGLHEHTDALNRRFVCYEHQLCHAASAYYPSPYDRALVLTMDSGGDMCPALAMVGEGPNLRHVSSSAFPDSLGWIYSQVTELIGYRPHGGEQKVQWLSGSGTPEFRPLFQRLIGGRSPAGLPTIDAQYVTTEAGRWRLARAFTEGLGVPTHGSVTDPKRCANIARSLQDFLEDRAVDAAERLRKRTATDYLCLAGGVFLNTFLIRALEDRTGFREIFVQPAAGNAGTAIGATYLAGRSQTAAAKREPLTHLYLGPGFDCVQIKAVLDNCKLIYRYYDSEESLVDNVVSLLRKGQSVAWYQDRLEFGFRALGNRSILASPFSPYVADNLNHYVKHREESHPFLLSVMAEAAATFVDCKASCRFAASVGILRQSFPDLERFVAGERRIRVHLVERDVNPRLWRLLQRFGQAAPAPILVNTSFNLFGEPLVCDPRDAVRSFFCAGIDAMAIGNFLLLK